LGPVFRAWDPASASPVAVKLFQLELRPEQVQQFVAELERIIAADLVHPAIVAAHAAGIHNSRAFLAQDFVVADSLDLVVREFGPAPPANALRVAAQLAGALDFAAVVNITHGALHPRDILLSSDDTRLTGIGVAQALERVGVAAPVHRAYSAPERIAGAAWDRRADVFSLAALIHELLWGRRISGIGARAVESLTSVAGSDLAALRATFARALAENPAVRFDTALDFAQALEDAFPHLTASAAPAANPTGAREARADEPRLPLDEPTDEATIVESTIAGSTLIGSRIDESTLTGSRAVDVDLPLSAHPVIEEERYRDVEVAPEIPELGTTILTRNPAAPPSAAEEQTERRPRVLTPPEPAPLPTVHRSRLAVWPLALAAIAGLAVGFAGGYGVGRSEQSAQSSLVSAAPTATAPTPAPVGREFTESAVAPPTTPAPGSSEVARQPAPAPAPEPDTPRVPAVKPSDAKPETAEGGRLLVRSIPARARVFVDGREQGRTPVAVRDLSNGTHSLRVVGDGYAPEERRILIAPSRPAQSLTIALEPLPVAPASPAAPSRDGPATSRGGSAFAGVLVVDSRPAGAKVFLDGTLVGTTPVSLPTVRAGEHAVRLERDGYRRWSSSVRVVSSERNRITASLER
jgi:serine/threonine protein kinase